MRPLHRADVGSTLKRLGVDARLRGREWHARCPHLDHDDRNPSWRMRDDPDTQRHGLFRCDSCGWTGTLIELVMYLLRVTREEARDWVGGSEDKPPEPPPSAVVVRVERWSRGFTFRSPVVFEPLEWWPEPARRYAESRGLTAAQVDRWGIGFAVEGRLAGRIVFAKRDASRAPLGYSARTFVNDPKRYLEPEPKERASTSAIFGEQHWPEHISRGCVFLAEGALNALALERIGAGYIAAAAGSELHTLHAIKLATWSRVVVVSDPDAAGDRLANAVASLLGRHDVLVERAILPVGTDAASVSPQLLEQAVRGAVYL